MHLSFLKDTEWCSSELQQLKSTFPINKNIHTRFLLILVLFLLALRGTLVIVLTLKINIRTIYDLLLFGVIIRIELHTSKKQQLIRDPPWSQSRTLSSMRKIPTPWCWCLAYGPHQQQRNHHSSAGSSESNQTQQSRCHSHNCHDHDPHCPCHSCNCHFRNPRCPNSHPTCNGGVSWACTRPPKKIGKLWISYISTS